MTVLQFTDYLKGFSDDAVIVLAEWDGPAGTVVKSSLSNCVNIEYQRANNVVMLRKSIPGIED